MHRALGQRKNTQRAIINKLNLVKNRKHYSFGLSACHADGVLSLSDVKHLSLCRPRKHNDIQTNRMGLILLSGPSTGTKAK
jgi:hypothetical protein